MEALIPWIDNIILAILAIVYIFRETGTKTLINNQKDSMVSLEKALKVFDPDKFLSMQKVYDDFNEKKIRLETAERFQKLNKLGEFKMGKEFDVIFGETLQFIVRYLDTVDADKRVGLINKLFPNSKDYIEKIYAEYGTHSKSEIPPPPDHSE